MERPKRLKESDVQKTILDYLALKGIFHYRSNTGVVKNKSGHLYLFGAVGSPDIVCIYRGRYIGIECKGPKGVQSEAQEKFQTMVERHGGVYILAYALEDVVERFPWNQRKDIA